MAENHPKRTLFAILIFGFILAAGAWSQRSDRAEEWRVPLLATAGPDNFTRFEMRSPEGEILWRLEAEPPSGMPLLVYAVIPGGFRQTQPPTGAPRPLSLGEDLILESRIPNRVFFHRGFANTESTIAILESEMHRLEPGEEYAPSEPPESSILVAGGSG